MVTSTGDLTDSPFLYTKKQPTAYPVFRPG